MLVIKVKLHRGQPFNERADTLAVDIGSIPDDKKRWDRTDRDGPEPTQVLNSVISVLLRQETATWGGCDLGNSGGRGITGGGSGYAALMAHAGGVLYGMELGSVTLKRIGFFCFPIKHSTHTGPERSLQRS